MTEPCMFPNLQEPFYCRIHADVRLRLTDERCRRGVTLTASEPQSDPMTVTHVCPACNRPTAALRSTPAARALANLASTDQVPSPTGDTGHRHGDGTACPRAIGFCGHCEHTEHTVLCIVNGYGDPLCPACARPTGDNPEFAAGVAWGKAMAARPTGDTALRLDGLLERARDEAFRMHPRKEIEGYGTYPLNDSWHDGVVAVLAVIVTSAEWRAALSSPATPPALDVERLADALAVVLRPPMTPIAGGFLEFATAIAREYAAIKGDAT